MKKRCCLIFLLSAMLLIGTQIPAQAIPYGFYGITSNSAADDIAIGEAQLSVDVTDPGLNQVLFTFSNSGPEDSAVAAVYFDDGTLLGIASIVNYTGVSFSQYASPPNLPGGETVDPPFVTTAGFLADSDPSIHNGVNPGESLDILFDLQSGKTYADVLSDLADLSLRIGIHVQAFADGESESFINNPNPIPEPASMLLLGTGLIGLAGLGRKKFRKS